MRYVKLTEEEKQQLESLYKTSSNAVIRQRCLCLLLSNKCNSIIQVSELLSISRRTVMRLIAKWDKFSSENKLLSLYSLKGQGAKVKLKPVVDILSTLLKQHNRNLKPILDVLEKEHSIKVCKYTLQTFLKGIGL